MSKIDQELVLLTHATPVEIFMKQETALMCRFASVRKWFFLITKLLVLLNWITWCLAGRYYLIKFSFDNILLPGSKEVLLTSIAFNISSPLFQEHGPNGEITQPAVQFVAVVRWSLEENVCLNRKIASEKMYAPEIAVLISVQVCSDWVQIVFQKVEIKNVIKL